MRQYKKNLLTASAVVAVILSIPAIANHTWGNASGTYHWNGDSLPVQLSVIDSVTPSWQTELNTALTKWNQSADLNLTINSSNDSATTRTNCATASGQIRVCNSTYGTTGWSGLASLNVDSSNHILWGTAKVNDSYSMSQQDKNKVICQEVGHLFGLGHTSTNGSSQSTCMDYATNPVNSQWPNAHDYALLDQIYAHIGGGGGGGTPSGQLSNGVTKTNLSGATNSSTAYYIDVPAGASNLSIVMNGGSGDADLYVKFGSAPTTTSYNCRPYKTGNAETCSFAAPSTGRYYIMIQGYSAYSATNLTGSFTAGGGGGGGGGCVNGNGVLCNGVTESGLSGTSGSQTRYYIDVPAGASNLKFAMKGGSGDADLYVKFGSNPTTTSYDCRPYISGNTETCSFSAPSKGRYNVMVRGYTSYSGTALTASYAGGIPSAANSATDEDENENDGDYRLGLLVQADENHEMWVTKNADDTITVTTVTLSGNLKPKQ